ncbi:MAG: HI0074 family nucleotidyltransferase substrate-binding subunit [Pseudomonadota bacterium]
MNELEYSIEKFKNALDRLIEGVKSSKDELDKDGVIQRFEFTFELLLKTAKIYLEDKGIRTLTPKDALKEAFRIGLITDQDAFLNMLDDRNKTSHIYNQATSEEIYLRIKEQYIDKMSDFLDELA